MRSRSLLGLVLVAALAGCGEGSDSTASSTASASQSPSASPSASPTPSETPSPVPTETPSPVVPVVTQPASPTAVNYGLDPGYPKVEPVAQVSDSRIRTVLRDTYHVTQAVVLAKNVYASVDASSAELADIVSGSSLIGLCANVKAFNAAHESRGFACY